MVDLIRSRSGTAEGFLLLIVAIIMLSCMSFAFWIYDGHQDKVDDFVDHMDSLNQDLNETSPYAEHNNGSDDGWNPFGAVGDFFNACATFLDLVYNVVCAVFDLLAMAVDVMTFNFSFFSEMLILRVVLTLSWLVAFFVLLIGIWWG